MSQLAQAEEEDPFDVFGSDQEDDDDDKETDKAAAVATTATDEIASTASASMMETGAAAGAVDWAKMTQQRDASCGPLVFHHGTELALLQFVERNIVMIQKAASSSLLKTTAEPAAAAAAAAATRKRERVIQLIDEFCYSRHWMMNIGPEKGAILDRFLVESLDRHFSGPQQEQPFTLVEVGTYCGYSTIRIAHTILGWQQQRQQQQPQQRRDFHIFTVDVNPQTVAIARQLVTMAGLDSHVTFLILSENNDDDNLLSKTIQSALQEKYSHTTATTASGTSTTSHVSFVFLDHCKTKYLSDLQQLEASQIIRAQTSVAADNVIFHGLDEYRDHLQQYASRGIVETRLEMGHLEYVATTTGGAGDDDDAAVFLPGTTTVTSRALPGNKQRQLQTNADFRDGLELTYYLKDPC